MAGGMSRVEPAKTYSVVYDVAGWPEHEYVTAANLSVAMQIAQAEASKRRIVVESIAEVLWRRDA